MVYSTVEAWLSLPHRFPRDLGKSCTAPRTASFAFGLQVIQNGTPEYTPTRTRSTDPLHTGAILPCTYDFALVFFHRGGAPFVSLFGGHGLGFREIR